MGLRLTGPESEVGETQTWLEFAVECKYMDREAAADLYQTYNEILRTIVGMINHPETWVITKPIQSTRRPK